MFQIQISTIIKFLMTLRLFQKIISLQMKYGPNKENDENGTKIIFQKFYKKLTYSLDECKEC